MNDAENVKSKLDIVEVVMGYVELKKAGKDYKGVSPFRQERTPSFFVSPEKQIWHDFGSNEGGDVISFIMQIEGMSFPEALALLADRAGVQLQKASQRQDSGKADLFRLTERAMKFYHLQLSRSPVALRYIKDKRGLDAATIKAFFVGYAPDEWTSVADHLRAVGATDAQLVAAGLCGRRAKGSGVYDVFRDRIMFPVFDAQGRIVGFSGRILTAEAKAAKYINTPDSTLYHKAVVIFGYHQAKTAIRASKRVLVVEGHLDVLSLFQAGYQNVVAVSGTALTAEQLKQLSRVADTIQLCFDQDSAGQKATQRSLELAQGLDVRMEVIRYEGAKDPDELVRRDKAAWDQALSSAEYGWDYLFRQAAERYPPEKSADKKAFVKAMVPVLQRMDDRVEQEHYLRLVSAHAGVEQEMIREVVASKAEATPTRRAVEPSGQSAPPPKSASVSRLEQLEQPLIELLLAYPETRVAISDMQLGDLSDVNRPLFEALARGSKVTLDEIGKLLPDSAEHVKILGLRGEHEYSAMTEHERGLEAFTQAHAVQKHILNLKKRRLTQSIAQAEQAGESAKAAELLQQYQQLVNDHALY